MRSRAKKVNAVCSECGKAIAKWPYQLRQFPVHFCNLKCKGKWQSRNWVNAGPNWKGGTWNNRVQFLAHSSYRTWRKGILEKAACFFCGGKGVELHHVISKVVRPDLIREEKNVVPVCASCHDEFHSNSRKGGELRKRLSALSIWQSATKAAECVVYVGCKAQRLMGEDATNKPDTSAAPERDEIVRASSKEEEV